jgi:CspA family cold shock protein
MKTQPTVRLGGRVKKFFPDRGFGFIIPIPPGPDVFVHVLDTVPVGSELRPGDDVAFEVEQRNGRPRAVRVRRLSSQPSQDV